MTDAVTNELMYEILRKIQGDVAHIKGRVDEHDQQFLAIREQLHQMQGQIHDVQGEILRFDRQFSAVNHRLERIDRRLELTDA